MKNQRQISKCLLGLLVCSLLGGCAQQTITGRAIGEETGDSIFWAKVEAYQKRPGQQAEKVKSTRTMHDGTFSLKAKFNPDDVIRLVVYKELSKDSFLYRYMNIKMNQEGKIELGDVKLRKITRPPTLDEEFGQGSLDE